MEFDLVDEAEGKEFSMDTADSQLMAEIPEDSARAVFGSERIFCSICNSYDKQMYLLGFAVFDELHLA